jgi:hypothetical protein
MSIGSSSAVTAIFGNGSYTPETGHRAARLACLKSAKTCREQMQQQPYSITSSARASTDDWRNR